MMAENTGSIDPTQARKPASDQIVFISDKTGLGSVSVAGQTFKILDVGYVCGYPTFTCMVLDRFACLFFPPTFCNVCAVCWHIEGIIPVPDWTVCGIPAGPYGLLVFFKNIWMCHCLKLLNYTSINVNSIEFVGTSPGFCGSPVIPPPLYNFNPFPFMVPLLMKQRIKKPDLSLDNTLSDKKKNFLNAVFELESLAANSDGEGGGGGKSDDGGIGGISVANLANNIITLSDYIDSDGCGEPFRPGLTHPEDYVPSGEYTTKDLCSEDSEDAGWKKNDLCSEIADQQNGSPLAQKDRRCIVLNPNTENIYSRMLKASQSDSDGSCPSDSNQEDNNKKKFNILGNESDCK